MEDYLPQAIDSEPKPGPRSQHPGGQGTVIFAAVLVAWESSSSLVLGLCHERLRTRGDGPAGTGSSRAGGKSATSFPRRDFSQNRLSS